MHMRQQNKRNTGEAWYHRSTVSAQKPPPLRVVQAFCLHETGNCPSSQRRK